MQMCALIYLKKFTRPFLLMRGLSLRMRLADYQSNFSLTVEPCTSQCSHSNIYLLLLALAGIALLVVC